MLMSKIKIYIIKNITIYVDSNQKKNVIGDLEQNYDFIRLFLFSRVTRM